MAKVKTISSPRGSAAKLANAWSSARCGMAAPCYVLYLILVTGYSVKNSLPISAVSKK